MGALPRSRLIFFNLYAIIYNNMQSNRKLSLLRRRLLTLIENPAGKSLLDVFLAPGPLARGTVYTLRRKCSKPSCRCARGEPHTTVVLTASVQGRTRLWTLPPDRVGLAREWTERYRQFRQARDRWVKWQREILRLIDAMGRSRIHPLP